MTKTSSIKRRITDNIESDNWEEAQVTVRRRGFMRCTDDAIRKGRQGAWLEAATGSEIDDEIIAKLNTLINVWTALRNELQTRRTRHDQG